jgi:hypothetical protein
VLAAAKHCADSINAPLTRWPLVVMGCRAEGDPRTTAPIVLKAPFNRANVGNPTRRKTLPETERIKELHGTLTSAVARSRQIRRQLDGKLQEYRFRNDAITKRDPPDTPAAGRARQQKR